MKDSSRQLLQKAARAIEAAEVLLENNKVEFAIGRTYYAMFYVAEALLNEKDWRFSKHGGVHDAFGKNFVKTSLFDAKYHRWLLDSFDQRIIGDYNVEVAFSANDAQKTLEQSREFLEEAQRYLQNQE